MASPNSSFTEIVTTSLQGYSGELADNVTNHNALWLRINEKGNKQTATGRTIVQELEYAENGTTQWYSGSENLNIQASDVFSAAEFNYKQLAGNVVINGLEQIQNSGREAVHNLLRSRMKNLTRTLTNEAGRAVYYDGTGNDGKEVGGLKLLVADSTSGTVGGINAASYTFWKNQTYDFSANSTSVGATGALLHAMNTLWVSLIRGADKPDLITADSVYFIKYLESLQSNQRFVDKKMADAGFTNVMYMSAPVVYDAQAPASHMYMLNTDYIFLRPAKGREFVPLGEKSSVNQDALVMPVVWAGNMTVSNRHLQGVIQA